MGLEQFKASGGLVYFLFLHLLQVVIRGSETEDHRATRQANLTLAVDRLYSLLSLRQVLEDIAIIILTLL